MMKTRKIIFVNRKKTWGKTWDSTPKLALIGGFGHSQAAPQNTRFPSGEDETTTIGNGLIIRRSKVQILQGPFVSICKSTTYTPSDPLPVRRSQNATWGRTCDPNSPSRTRDGLRTSHSACLLPHSSVAEKNGGVPA